MNIISAAPPQYHNLLTYFYDGLAYYNIGYLSHADYSGRTAIYRFAEKERESEISGSRLPAQV